ncbi:MAG TPA: DUF1552 domain-containing protein [Polyangiaceae bacterium]|nr:DUF1552 domain-containing protein [Polyangiaceae bacterium]
MKKLTRRMVLHGAAGALISLPLLEAMMPRKEARADVTPAPKRLVFVHMPNGYRHSNVYTVSGSGNQYVLPAVQAPLAAFQKKLTVIANLDNSIAIAAGVDHHAGGTAGLLTAYPCQQTGAAVTNGTSVDQTYAQAVGAATPIASLPLGSMTYSNYSVMPTLAANVSWQAGMPLSKEIDAQRLWNRLFGMLVLSPDDLARQRAHQQSVLNGATADANALRAKLGTTDRAKLDQYLSGVAALEKKILTNSTCIVPPPALPGVLTNDGAAIDVTTTGVSAHVDTMFDLVAHAFACDLTRSVSFMLPDGGFTNWQWMGFSDQHHALTHDADDPLVDPNCGLTNAQKIDEICVWEAQRIAHLLGALDAIEDVDGRTLLDNTLVFVSSDVGDAAYHSHDTMPVLLAGGGGTVTKMGEYIVASPGDQGPKGQQPFANLFLSMLEFAGVHAQSFGATSLNSHILEELMV